MNDFIKQDIFFFITSIAVVVLTVLVGVLLVYFIRISRNIHHISDKVRAETDVISEELGELRRNIRKEGVRIKHFAKFFGTIQRRKK